MQENKFDKNQLIGFGLMILLVIGYWYFTAPTPEQIEAEKKELAKKEAEKKKAKETVENTADFQQEQNNVQSNLPTQTFTLENDKISIELTNKGAQLSKVELKEYKAYNHETNDDDLPLYLFNDKNANFSLKINDKEGRLIDLSKRTFSAQQKGNSVIFSTQENGGTIQYIYTLNGDYDLDFSVRSQGLGNISADKTGQIDFVMDAISQEKGLSWEKRVTDIHYSLNNHSETDYTRSDKTLDSDEKLDWVAFKQQFFTTVLEPKIPFDNAVMTVTDDGKDEKGHSKTFTFNSKMNINGELNENYTWHFFPLDFRMLEGYGKEFQEIIPFGWGIFGVINEWVILPTFLFMASWGLKYGWVIALLTIVVKLITSPIMYKQYKQSAMMKVLKPDIEEINEKYKGTDNQMKRQQETMKLYRTAGVNPLAGCLPALLQIPIFYALFNFFPNVIDLRAKGFLWAEDLTAYDSIMPLPFNIPFYGDHVSLFALMYVVTMVIYFKFSGNMMQTPKQEGMPDMRFMMYIMPVMFIFFLNSYASGLSWYYFVSNAINIGLVLLIKNVLIDDEKIHAKIQQNKKNPKKRKKSKWQQRLDDAMKQAQEQQKLKNQGK